MTQPDQIKKLVESKNLNVDTFKSSFALVHSQEVAWGDMDAFAHLNNVTYYRYIESARIAYMSMASLFSDGVSPVVVTNSCHYRVSVEFPDTLLIGVYISHLGNSSLTMNYVLYSTQKSQVVATADAVVVLMNESMTNSVAIPVALRKKVIDQEQKFGRALT